MKDVKNIFAVIVGLVLATAWVMPSDAVVGLSSSPRSAEREAKIGAKEQPWNKNRPAVYSGIPPAPARLQAEKRLLEKYPARRSKTGRLIETLIRWDSRTGLPRELNLDSIPLVATEKSAQTLAEEFIAEWQYLLGIDLKDFGPPQVNENGNTIMLEYPQIYKGVPLLSSGLKIIVQIDPAGKRVETFDSDYHPNIHGLPHQPKLSAQQAADVVKAFEEVTDNPQLDTSLHVLPDCFNQACHYRLVWRITLPTQFTFTGYFVDALTGEIVGEFPTVVN